MTDPSPEERARETHLDEAQVDKSVGFHEKTLAVWLWKKQWIKIIEERKGCRSYLTCKLSHSSKQFFVYSHFKKKFLLITLLLLISLSVQFSSLSRVWLFATPWTAAYQASLSITNSGFTQTYVHWVGDAIQPSHPLSFPSLAFNLFPASGSFQMSQFFASGGQRVGVSASDSVVPMNIQDWFPLGWTGCISLQSKGLSRVFSNTTVQKYQFISAQLSL